MATFTIYLLRESMATAEEAVVTGVKPLIIADGPSDYGKLFVKLKPPRPEEGLGSRQWRTVGQRWRSV